MPRIELGPLGAVISPAPDPVTTAAAAAEVEGAGFPTIWLAGGALESLEQVTAAVTATRSARIGTAIISVDRFGAADVASRYADLQGEHPGRFVVGLGGAHGAKPLATLRAYLDTLDTVPRESIVLSALGPRMLELARDRSSGAIPVLVTPEYAARARETLGDDATLAVQLMVVLETDAERARAAARQPLSFLRQVPGYSANFRRMGFTDDDIEQLSDRIVDALVAWGDGDEIAARVAQFHAAGADHVTVMPLVTDPSPWKALGSALLR
ncbi:MAG: TIGR03620 family F420-dependent LLM class oxidoreductase [Streptosporangiales bacterium]|nr:TIGR03620 family F420-dependent LLM class oxidoreductase [Streptosporangiales bacterium]MBO0890062.1 TIGR03620 family F420-dependent LLM class oxidoreductase [Acidothermales bacterium]